MIVCLCSKSDENKNVYTISLLSFILAAKSPRPNCSRRLCHSSPWRRRILFWASEVTTTDAEASEVTTDAERSVVGVEEKKIILFFFIWPTVKKMTACVLNKQKRKGRGRDLPGCHCQQTWTLTSPSSCLLLLLLLLLLLSMGVGV